MKKYKTSYYFSFIVVTIALLGCQQEKVQAQYSRIPVDRVKDGLKDSVKSVSSEINLPIRDSISKEEYVKKYLGWQTDLERLFPYSLYADDGRFIVSESGRDSLRQPLDSMRDAYHIRGVKYDLKNYYKKQQYKIPYKYPYQVYNPYQVYVTKEDYAPVERAKEENGYKYLNSSFDSYEYIYDQKGEKILQDVKFLCFDLNKDGIIDVKGKDSLYITNYIYDSKNRLVRKDFDMSILQEKSTGFSALESEQIYDDVDLTVPIWYYSWQEFEYDDHDNLMRYSLKYSLEKTGAKEHIEYEDKYYYTANNDIYKIERYYPGFERYAFGNQPMNTDKRILYYNDKGHLIKSEGIPRKSDAVAVTRLYTYEYDERGNWLRCNVYLKGEIEPKPHVYIDRYIEYYNE